MLAYRQSDIAWPQTENIPATVKDVNKKNPNTLDNLID